MNAPTEYKKFRVTVSRTETVTRTFDVKVEVNDGHESVQAYADGLEQAKNTEFPRSGDAEYVVEDVEEVKEDAE
jgi:hypothetical protein